MKETRRFGESTRKSDLARMLKFQDEGGVAHSSLVSKSEPNIFGDRRLAINHANFLRRDSLIDQLVERSIQERDTAIGIITSSFGTSAWQIGSLGKVNWIVGNSSPPWERGDDEPPWYNSYYDITFRRKVEVIIVEGDYSLIPEQLWFDQSLQVIVCFTKARRKGGNYRKRKRKRTPDEVAQEGWRPTGCRRIKHSTVGGVTTGVFFVLTFAREKVKADWDLPDTITRSLGDALDSTIQGDPCPLPDEGCPNSYLGLLSWKMKKEKVVANTVFHEGAVRRMITPLEWSRVMDFPYDKALRMTEENLLLLKDAEVPGKIVYAGIYFLESYYQSKPTEARSKKRRIAWMDERDITTVEKRIKLDEGLVTDQEVVSDAGPVSFQEDQELIASTTSDHQESEFDLWAGQCEFSSVTNDVDALDAEPAEAEPTAKAVKSDDAKVPIQLWNDRVVHVLKNE